MKVLEASDLPTLLTRLGQRGYTVLGFLPARLTVLAVQGRHFHAAGLSPPVAAAVDRLVDEQAAGPATVQPASPTARGGDQPTTSPLSLLSSTQA